MNYITTAGNKTLNLDTMSTFRKKGTLRITFISVSSQDEQVWVFNTPAERNSVFAQLMAMVTVIVP